jgi:hypothetical protein
LLCGAILFSACPNETVETVIGYGTALSLNADGDWEDVDVLSGASIFKLDYKTMVYIDNGGHTLKKVDVTAPTVALNVAEVGYNVEVIQGSKEGKIAVIAGTHTSSGFINSVVKIYDSSLNLLKEFPFGDEDQAVASSGGLYSMGSLGGETGGASLAIGDKYAVVLWTDGNDTWTVQGGRGATKAGYVGIYDIVGNKGSKHFKFRYNPTLAEGETEPSNAIISSGIVSAVSVATHGDYVVLGGTGSAAFKIDAATLDLTVAVEKGDDTVASHWAVDNGYYALDCGMYTVKVWKWNGADVPTRMIITGVGKNQIQANRGHVRLVSYDPDDPSKAYAYVKNTSATEGGTATAGEPNGFYKLDLAAGTKQFLFFPTFKNGAGGESYIMGGPWVIDRFVDGSDTWYVIGGSTVEVFKNPDESGGNIDVTPDWSIETPNTAHYVRFFKANDRLFVVTKDGNADDYPIESTLVVHEIE